MRKLYFFITLYLLLANTFVFAQHPIKVARTISFITQEGSNMSVDISPDEKTIVFDLLGDLYTLPLKGGNATQITRGIAVNTCPVWSPKGDHIAYISDGSGDKRLTVMGVSGSAIQTFGDRNEGIPVWFGTDNWVTTANFFFLDFPLYHLTGSAVKLPKEIYHVVGSSADGKSFFYKQTTESGGWNIHQYTTSTGAKKLLIEWDKKAGEGVKVSKDAHWLSYLLKEGASCSLILVDLTSKKEKVLASWQQNVPSSGLGNYTFSQDSKQILIAYGGKIHLIDLEIGKDKIVPFTANVKVDMGKLNEGTFRVLNDYLQVKYMRSACASPDGKHLVFSALCRIYIMDLPNGTPRVLVNQTFNQFHPSWSVDGKWITYVSWSDKDFGAVWKVDINGEKLTKITREPGAYYYPCLSPDGKSIIVGKGSWILEEKPVLAGREGPGMGKLLCITLKDGFATMITDSVALASRAEFSADGETIIYKPALLNEDKILPCLIAKKQMEKRILATTTPPPNWLLHELFLKQIFFSPNGKYIVYLNEENLHLVPVGSIGEPTLLYNKKEKLPVIRFARGGFDPHWEQGGKVLSWSFANQYFQIDPEKIVAEAIKAAEERAKKEEPAPEILDVYVIPDKTVTIGLKAPGKTGKGLLALKNMRIISMKGAEVIEKGTVLIKNGRLMTVGKVENISIPNDAKVMDLTGKTIIPGLIDLHDHVGGLPPEVFREQKWNLLVALVYGTTTAREPSGAHDYFGYEEVLATGQMTGPRLFNVSYAVRGSYPNLNHLEEARIIVQNRARMGAKVVKQYTQPTRLQRQFLLQASEEAGLNMTNEVEQDMSGFIGHIKDGTGGIEHNPLWGEAYNDVIQLVARSGVYLTPTLQALFGTKPAKYEFTEYFNKLNPKLARFYPQKEIVRRSLQKQIENPNEPSFLNHSKIDAAIRHAGGRVTMGSHGEDPGLGAHFEIWALQMGGLTNLEALQSATIMAAGALGMQEDLGSIEPGKIADLIILNKNPLDNIRNTIEIQSVMKDGVLYDGNTLDEIWPKAKKFKWNK